jgi:hypothetical protein
VSLNLRVALSLCVALSAHADAQSDGPKLLFYGWGLPEVTEAARRHDELDSGPLDGTAFVIPVDPAAWQRGDRSTRNQLGWNVFGPVRLASQPMRDAIAPLSRLEWSKLRINFLPIVPSSRDQDDGFSWFDDARWEVILENWRTLISLARDAGLRGLVLDPEHYGARFFRYPEMVVRAPNTFGAYRDIVQARAATMMREARRLFPAMEIVALYGHSLARRDPLWLDDYGLYPAFLDGLMEAAGPEFVLTDGYEFSYGFKSQVEFERGQLEARQRGLAVTRRPKEFRHFVRIGFGIWVDNEGTWNTSTFDRNYFSPAELSAALRAAKATTERYVWLYAQRPRLLGRSSLPGAYANALVDGWR